MRKLLNKREIIWLASGFLLVLLGFASTAEPRNSSESDYWACIYRTSPEGNQLLKQVRLDEEHTITLQGPIGTTVIEVKKGKVRVLSSDCPDHLCVKFGWLQAPPDFSACLPNEVLIVVQEPADISEGPFGPWDD